jgi:hypothetical protein
MLELRRHRLGGRDYGDILDLLRKQRNSEVKPFFQFVFDLVEEVVDKELFFQREFHLFEGFNVVPVTFVGRHGTRGVMRAQDVAFFLQTDHVIPHGCGTHVKAAFIQNAGRGNGNSAGYILPDDGPKD